MSKEIGVETLVKNIYIKYLKLNFRLNILNLEGKFVDKSLSYEKEI